MSHTINLWLYYFILCKWSPVDFVYYYNNCVSINQNGTIARPACRDEKDVQIIGACIKPH